MGALGNGVQRLLGLPERGRHRAGALTIREEVGITEALHLLELPVTDSKPSGNGAAGVVVAPRGRPSSVMGFTVAGGRLSRSTPLRIPRPPPARPGPRRAAAVIAPGITARDGLGGLGSDMRRSCIASAKQQSSPPRSSLLAWTTSTRLARAERAIACVSGSEHLAVVARRARSSSLAGTWSAARLASARAGEAGAPCYPRIARQSVTQTRELVP